MRIALVCPDDLSVVLFCKGIVQTLQRMDRTEVYVISDVFGDDGYYSRILSSWGVRHVISKMTRYIDPLRDLKLMSSLCGVFRREKIRVVINISTKPNILGTIAARIAHIDQILCSVWGRGSIFVEDAGLKTRFLAMFLSRLYALAFRLTSKAWFTNSHDLEFFRSHKLVPEKKVILTKNYVSTEDYVPVSLSPEKETILRRDLGIGPYDKVVIMVGRMIWAKGVREFVNASKLLRDRLPNIKFVLVGPLEKGSPDAVPETYLKESEKQGNFFWAGFRRDVKDLYALAALAVLPSYYKEGGYPRALTEPMAMGKPVITTDSADCRAPVEEGKNGYLVPIKDPQALANAIERLMRDEELRKEFGRYSRIKAVQEFDEKTIVHHVMNEFLRGNMNTP